MRTVKSRLMLMPVVVGCLLTVSSSACGARRPSTPGAPTAPTAPTSPAVPTATLSGTVVERFSGQPLQGVQVGLWPHPTNRIPRWPPEWWISQRPPSDSGGRYTITGIPAGFGSFIVSAWYAEGKYVQQCATTVTLNADANQDITLTSLPNLAAGNSLRPPHVPGTRTISGVVFEVTAAGRQPIEGGTVGFEGNNDITSAWTFTDASGRFLLCGLPETRLTSLFAVKNGYSRDDLWKSVDAGSDTTLDIELKR